MSISSNGERRKADETRAVIKGSGNVFRDLGFSGRSAELILKSSLLQAFRKRSGIEAGSRSETAARLGIDQAKVSKLVRRTNGGIFGRTFGALPSMLGQDVEVTVRQAPRGQRYGIVSARSTPHRHFHILAQHRKIMNQTFDRKSGHVSAKSLDTCA